MHIRTLEKLVRNALEDVKGMDICIVNTRKRAPLFDRLVIASGSSNRHVRALAQSVVDRVKAAGGTVLSMEGEEGGEWVLVDLGDVVVHVMQPTVRSYYDLESLWQTAVPARRKATAKTALAP